MSNSGPNTSRSPEGGERPGRGAGFNQLLRVTDEKREKAYGLERKVLIKRWVKDKEVRKQRQWSNRERQWGRKQGGSEKETHQDEAMMVS